MQDCMKCREKLEDILSRLNRLTKLLEIKQCTSPELVFFDNYDFIQVMNISKRTAQSWRDSGLIGFSQIGGKIYYRLSDIQESLKKHYKPLQF